MTIIAEHAGRQRQPGEVPPLEIVRVRVREQRRQIRCWPGARRSARSTPAARRPGPGTAPRRPAAPRLPTRHRDRLACASPSRSPWRAARSARAARPARRGRATTRSPCRAATARRRRPGSSSAARPAPGRSRRRRRRAPTMRSRFFDSTGAAASALQPAADAPDVVGQVAAQRVRDDLGAADEVAVLLLVVADARDDASLGVDGDDRVDAAARQIGDQRPEAILDRAVDDRRTRPSRATPRPATRR